MKVATFAILVAISITSLPVMAQQSQPSSVGASDGEWAVSGVNPDNREVVGPNSWRWTCDRRFTNRGCNNVYGPGNWHR